MEHDRQDDHLTNTYGEYFYLGTSHSDMFKNMANKLGLRIGEILEEAKKIHN